MFFKTSIKTMFMAWHKVNYPLICSIQSFYEIEGLLILNPSKYFKIWVFGNDALGIKGYCMDNQDI